MRRFKFTLERLLEIRRHKEKLVENEVSQITAKKVRAIERKNKLIQKRKNVVKDLRNVEKRKLVNASEYIQYQRFFNGVDTEVKYQDKLIFQIDEELKPVIQKLIEARKKRRMLERLKEKQYQRYLKDVEKEEQNFYDEVGVNISARKEKAEIKKKIEIPIKYKETPEDIFEYILKLLRGE